MRIERLVVSPLQTNCYIVADDNGSSAIIDPGGDVQVIEGYIQDNNLTVTKILLTHGHPDHLFAAGQLQQAHKLELVMHGDDVEGIEPNLEIAAMFYDMNEYVPPKPTQLVSDGDIVTVGEIEFQVIHTPGHTPGGICFLNDGVIFSGDTLFAGSIGRTDFLGGSFDALMDSIKNRLLTLSDSTRVYPGHGGETTIGNEKMFNPFIS
jgi:glyoxylase-like metal-dependent hydrolase (beta-lactamase superfamily II)